jgi:hypothetical protein
MVRKSCTAILHKLAKPWYNTPNVYRAMVLFNMMCKVLTTVVVLLISYYHEKHSLLPIHHIRERPGRMTTNMFHLLAHKIKDMGRKWEVMAVLFLNIEGAILNMIMKKTTTQHEEQGPPGEGSHTYKHNARNRCMVLHIDNHTSMIFKMKKRISLEDTTFNGSISILQCWYTQHSQIQPWNSQNLTYRGHLNDKGTAEEDIRLYREIYKFSTHLQRKI